MLADANGAAADSGEIRRYRLNLMKLDTIVNPHEFPNPGPGHAAARRFFNLRFRREHPGSLSRCPSSVVPGGGQ